MIPGACYPPVILRSRRSLSMMNVKRKNQAVFHPTQRRNTFFLGGVLGIKAAIIGSVVFAFLDTVGVIINTYRIDRMDTSTYEYHFDFFWLIALSIIGIIFLTFIPGTLFGILLSHLVEKFRNDGLRLMHKSIITGFIFGVISGIIICLPIVILQTLFVLDTGHGSIPVVLYRSLEAMIIAAGAGGLTGREITIRSRVK